MCLEESDAHGSSLVHGVQRDCQLGCLTENDRLRVGSNDLPWSVRTARAAIVAHLRAMCQNE